MSIEEKYKDANENQQAIDLLPEIVTFLASIASADKAGVTQRPDMPVRRLELAAKNVGIVWGKIEMLLAIDSGTSYLFVIK